MEEADRHLPLRRDHISKGAALHLQKAGDGRIIALVGDSSRVGKSGLAIVAAARSGVIALMKSLAREMGRFGTTANTLSLGLIETPHDLEWVNANREKLTKLYPLKRLGFPSDIAPMVSLLASKHRRLDHRPDHQHQRRLQHGLTPERRRAVQ